jgi:tetratricopeptide (TPR) repeat protein
VHLPDLRIGPTSYDDGGFPEHLVEYDQGSIEYPVALALFPQHPLLRSRVPLNPEVMTTGPIDQESLEVKVRASETVGRVASLLATSPNRVTHPNTNAVRLLRTNNDLVVLENYFNVGLGGPRIWESINRSHAKILSIKDARWDQPLKIAEPSRSLVPPLIPTIGRHQQALDEMLAAAGAVQLLGLSGIGKTFLVAQWLLVAQQNYDLVIYASIPNFPPEEKFMTQWVASAFENLGEQLSTSWGRPEFLQKLTAKQTLIGSAWELVGALRESLAGSRILWVIDHAESLLNSDFEISEPRFFALIKSFALGDWENSKLLFVSNRRAQIAAEFPVYELRDGFTFTEACDYLSPKVWRFAELREKVAKVLGNHPRALALLVGHAGDYSIHPAEIRELIHSLPEEQGEVDLREVVCNKILGHVVKHLKSESLAVWWTLLLASVFVEDFTARQFQRLTQVVPASVSISDPFQALSNLVRRSLLSESDGKWAMHSLVRDYSQTIFSREYPKQRKLAHQKAGETYFPLTKSGQILPSPPAHVKSLYADAGGCATALYHFEAAEYVKGEQAILGNYYEHLVPKVQWFMANPRRGTNPIYGFARAEKILRKILEVNASKTEVSAYPGAKEVSYDINRLMGRALFRQRNISKYEEAAVHYREAVRKGDQASLAFLIAVLCDLSDEQPATNSSWLEAEELFETLSTVIVASKSKVPARVGMAYEKVARRYLLLGDPVLADLIVEEAAERSVAWDGVYLAGAEIAQVNLRDEEIGRWLERGLQLVPQSSRLWSRYYQLKVHRGDAHTISDELRFYPRGIHSVVGLSEELAQEGFVNDALNVLHDGLETYKRNATLLAALANTLAHADDLNAAIACYEEAIKEAPLRGELYVALGRLHEVQGNDAAALRTYELGRSNEVIDGQVYIALGGFLAQRGQLKEAVEVFHEGFAIAPKDGHLYNALGSIYKRMSETAQSEQLRNDYIQRALSIYKQGIESCPSVGGLYDSLGDLLLIEGRAQEALEIYKLGSQLAPLHEVLYEKAGTLHAAIDSADSIPLKEIAIDRTSVHSVGNDIMRSVETTSPK